jgi:penicillin-binding protein A
VEREIQRLGAFFLAGFAVLALAAGYWQVWQGPSLAVAVGNPRVIEAERRAERGAILDRRGQVLAESRDGRRVYATPELAHVTGYFSYRYGRTGLERAYHGVLSGREGLPPGAALLRALSGAPRRGGSVQTTVDAGLQAVASRALGDAQGAVVVLDVRTGAVLAAVSKPTFDPGLVDEQWTTLSQAESRPLYNRVSQGLYVPGSTFKLVTATAALDAALIQPTTQVSDPTGETVVDGFRITDAERPPRPTFDFAHAVVWSSNVVFAQVGQQVGEARLRDYAGRFGMGRQLPFELEASPTSVFRTEPVSRVMLASSAFGQGELLQSPLQMALVAATIARDGDVPRPTAVLEVRGPTGDVLTRLQPASLGRAMSPRTAAQLREIMALSVEEGFARPAAIPGVRVGGKTGTAQSVPGLPDHSWYVGIAPVERPRFAIAIIKEYGGWGSEEAAPIARVVLEEALRTIQ